jgi:hypothetical protein
MFDLFAKEKKEEKKGKELKWFVEFDSININIQKKNDIEIQIQEKKKEEKPKKKLKKPKKGKQLFKNE